MGKSDVRRILWEKVEVADQTIVQERPDQQRIASPKANAERVVRVLAQAQDALREISEEARRIERDSSLTKGQKERRIQDLKKKQKVVENEMKKIRNEASRLAKQGSGSGRNASGTPLSDRIQSATTMQRSPSGKVASATENVKSATQTATAQANKTQDASQGGQSKGGEGAILAQVFSEISNQLGEREQIITPNQISSKPGVAQKMEDLSKEIQQQRLDQAAGKADHIQQQLAQIQQKIANAAGLQKELDQIRKDQQKSSSSSQQGGNSSSSQPGSEADPLNSAQGSGGMKDPQIERPGGPAQELNNFKMDIDGVASSTDLDRNVPTPQDPLWAMEDENVPPNYRSVVQRYLQSLSSDQGS